jgi:hypothetical protein
VSVGAQSYVVFLSMIIRFDARARSYSIKSLIVEASCC